MSDIRDIKSKVAKEYGTTRRTALRTRWDTDLDTYLLKSHTMYGKHGDLKDKPLPGVYNVTSSSPQTYLDRVTSILSRTEPRLRIVSSISDNQIELITNWWKGVLDSANKLQKGNSSTLVYPTMCFYTNLRGWVSTRNVIYKDGDETCFEIRPIDIYDLYWKRYKDKFSWVCIYIQQLSSDDISSDYDLDISGDLADVYNFWGRDGIETSVAANKKKDIQRSYVKHPPFTIVPVVTTPEVSGTNTDKYKMVGESLYHSCRGVINERNDILSIIKTHAMLGMRPPLVHKTDGTEPRELKEYPTWGSVIEQFAEEGFDALKFGDMANVDAMFYNMMDGEYQQATVPSNEYGGLNFQLSALALDTLAGQRGVVFMPRQQTLEFAYSSIFEQMMEQFIDGGFTMQMIDASGKEKEISYVDLAPLVGKFRYDFDSDVETPEQEQATFSKAMQATQGGMPMDFVVRNIYKAEDPERLLGLIEDEALMKELPELRLVRAYDRAMKEAANLSGDERDAKLLEARLLNARVMQVVGGMQNQGVKQ